MSTHLDRLVCIHVLGWRADQPPPDDRVCRSAADAHDGNERAPVWWEKDDQWRCGWCCGPPRDPSTNIADAFEALEHWRGQAIHARRYKIESPLRCEPGGWDIFYVVLEDFESSQYQLAEGDTLPAAICRALLLVVGVSEAEMEEPTGV